MLLKDYITPIQWKCIDTHLKLYCVSTFTPRAFQLNKYKNENQKTSQYLCIR